MKIYTPREIEGNTIHRVSSDSQIKVRQLKLQKTGCNVPEDCIMGHLLFTHKAGNEDVWGHLPKSTKYKDDGKGISTIVKKAHFGDDITLYPRDFPIYVPPALLKQPFTDISFMPRFEQNEHKTCHLENCLMEITTFEMSKYSSQNSALSFSGKCNASSIEIQHTFKLFNTRYSVCSLQHLRHPNKGISYRATWVQVDKHCKRQNKTLPSFNSRKELMSFIHYWYPHNEENRLYEEIGIFIDLNSEVCLKFLPV